MVSYEPFDFDSNSDAWKASPLARGYILKLESACARLQFELGPSLDVHLVI